MKQCKWRGCTRPVLVSPSGKKTEYCGPKCKNKFGVQRRRERLKVLAVEYRGGSCVLCGYARCVGSMHFHHLDPGLKEFRISSGHTMSWARLVVELDKCALVCANCHGEIHAGMVSLSALCR